MPTNEINPAEEKARICRNVVGDVMESLLALEAEIRLARLACEAVQAERGNCDVAMDHLEIHVDCMGDLYGSMNARTNTAKAAIMAARICQAKGNG